MMIVAVTCLTLLLQDQKTISGKVAFPEDPGPKPRLKIRYPDQSPRQEKKEAPFSAALVYLEGAPPAKLAEGLVEIKQEGLQFQPRAVALQRGMRVSFPNLDNEYHNVFSYSKAKRFDLGRYPKGETREVAFGEVGLVRIFCEIHEHMRAYILVVDHPYYAAAAKDGRFQIPHVPPGTYTLVAWHERFESIRKKIEVKSDDVDVDLTFTKATPEPEQAGRTLGCCERPPGDSAR